MPFVRKIWKKQLCERLASYIIRRSFYLLILAVILTLIGFVHFFQLKIDSDYMAFLPENFSGVRNFKQVMKKTGGFGNFMLVLQGASPQIRRQFVDDFSKEVIRFTWVDFAESQKGWQKIEKSKLLLVSLEDLNEIYARLDSAIDRKKQEKNPLFVSLLGDDEEKEVSLDFSDIERRYQMTTYGSPYYEDPELQNTIAIVWPKGELPKGSMTDVTISRNALNDLKRLLVEMNPARYDPTLKADIGGEYRSKIDEYDSLLKNVLGSSLLTIGGILVLLILFYRSVGAVFYTLIPLILGTLWTAILANVLVGSLNLLTVYLAAILFGIGIDFSIYLFSRYLEERSSHETITQTIASVLYDTGRALISAGLTTAIAFATLIFTDFKGFREFGLLAFLGLLVLMMTTIIYSPLLWFFGEQLKLIRPDKIQEHGFWLPRFSLSRGVVIAGLIISIMGLVAIPFISFELDYGKLRSRTNSYWNLNAIIHKVFPLSKTPAIVLTESLEETADVVNAVKEIIPRSKTVDTVKSILDFLPSAIDEKKEVLKKMDNLITRNFKLMSKEDQEKVEPYLPLLRPDSYTLEDLPRSLLRKFVADDGNYFVHIYDKVRLSDAKNASAYGEEIGEIRTSKNVYYPAEGSLIFAQTLQLMKKESALAFCVMLLVIFLVFVWEFRNVRQALIVFTPVILGFLLTMGTLALLGIKLNMFNLVIFPILIGVADDSSIHLYERFVAGHGRLPIQSVIHQASNSILLAGLTTIVGFASILTSDHQGLRSLSIVALIGLLSHLISSLIFFPAFLNWIISKISVEKSTP